MNELLLWMSVRRSGSEHSFRARVAELDSDGLRAVGRHRFAEWNLFKLGHAEFGRAADGAGWRIAPPVLAAGDYQGSHTAILCGARTPNGMAALAVEAGPCRLLVCSQQSCPDIVELAAPTAPELAAAAARAGLALQWNAPLAVLASCKPPKAIPLVPMPLPVGGWVVSRFSKSHFAWVESSVRGASDAVSGLFRFKAEHSTVYVLVEHSRSFACDPAEAKYRIFRRRNRALLYDAKAHEFAVRASCRPPALVERALVLCSGRIPAVRDGQLIYGRVERAVAAAAAALLGQRLS